MTVNIDISYLLSLTVFNISRVSLINKNMVGTSIKSTKSILQILRTHAV